MMESVPRMFRRYHSETIQRLLKGCVAAHRGQVGGGYYLFIYLFFLQWRI